MPATAVIRAGASFSIDRTSGTDVVYVSLPPGTIPNGGLAIIRNTRTGGEVPAAMAAGGFDPVPVEAGAGDILALEIQLAGGGSQSLTLTVPTARGPIVVRTYPPPRKRDVPLNTYIVVVFSEPIRASTTGSIRLLRSGAPVGGRAVLTADGLRAAFQPDQLLAPNTDYVLSIPTEVVDLSGDPLEQAVAAEFTTGGTVAVASVATEQAALFTNPYTGTLRTFEMHAIRYDDGSVSGSWTTFYPEDGYRATGVVACFTIVGGKAAWIAGVRSDGDQRGWRAVDNGPPEGGVPDQLSLNYSLVEDSLGTAQEYCAATPTTGPVNGAIELHNLISGNIVVNSSAPPPPEPPGGMSQIAFWSGGIGVMNADGSNVRQLTTNPVDYQPTWSPDARMIAFARQRYDLGRNDLDIFVMNADGSGVRQLTSDLPHDGAPAWSPDGTRIAFLRGGETYVTNAADGSGTTRLGPGGCGSDDGIAWSPDGSRIAFSRAGTPGCHIYVMNADGSGVTQLTTDSTQRDIDPAWSPDGAQIAFLRDGAVYVMRATDGAGATKLADAGNGFGGPSWSPDGSMIAFSGFSGIAVMNADGSAIRRVGYGNSPAWTRVGSVPPAPVLTLQKVAGDQQTDTVLATLAAQLQVRVLANNVPVPGIVVSWGWGNAIPGSGGSITSGPSDASGIASATVTFGPLAREIVVEASAGGVFGSVVAFTGTARPGTPVRLDGLRGADQFTVVNAYNEYWVIARDGHGYPGSGGNVVSGVPITWAVTAGGGSITPTQDTTALDPRSGYSLPFSSAVHTLGPNEGTAEATATAATVPGAPQVTFTTTVVSWIVRVVDGGFVPEGVSVPSGGRVVWFWGWPDYTNEYYHNVTFEDDPTQPTSSPDQYQGLFTRVFSGAPRTIRYRCTLHSTSFTEGEVGTVTVQ